MSNVSFDYYLDGAFYASLGKGRTPLPALAEAEVPAIHSGDRAPMETMREAILRSEIFRAEAEDGVK